MKSVHVFGRAYDIDIGTLGMFKRYEKGQISRHALADRTGIEYSDIEEVEKQLVAAGLIKEE